MSEGLYELLALLMRYLFAGLMLLIVFRGWRISVVDSARARRLRRLSPDTGIVGEMLICSGAHEGERCALTLEGCIGSSRRADIRLRGKQVRARHAIYCMTEQGLSVRGHAGAMLMDERGVWRRSLTLQDGERLRVGGIWLMPVLTQADAAGEELSRSGMRRRRLVSSGRRLVDSEQRTVASGQRAVDSGRRLVDSEQWAVDSDRRSVGSDRRADALFDLEEDAGADGELFGWEDEDDTGY